MSNTTAFRSSPVIPAPTANWYLMTTAVTVNCGDLKKIYLVDLRPAWRPRCICFHLFYQNIRLALTLHYCNVQQQRILHFTVNNVYFNLLICPAYTLLANCRVKCRYGHHFRRLMLSSFIFKANKPTGLV